MKPYLIMKNETGKVVEVDLYGEVVEDVPVDFWTGEKISGLYIGLKDFLAELDNLKDADEITFHINSIGGDVAAGLSIYNRIRGLKAKTTTIVDGLAASAASVIAQAGDIRQVSVGAQTMIHGASTLMIGYYNQGELQKAEAAVEATNKSIAGVYANSTGKEAGELLRMMKKETWMTPEEAVENGFADEIIGVSAPTVNKIDGMKDILIVNGITHRLHGIPAPDMKIDKVYDQKEIVNGGKPLTIDTENPNKEVKTMDSIKEFKDTYPDLYGQIVDEVTATACAKIDAKVETAVKEAVEADRNRIKEIDSIAKMVGDTEMVEHAKYAEPISASELALKAMQAQQTAGKEFIETRSKELEETDNINPMPNSGMEDKVAEETAELNALVAKLKKED